MLYFSLLEIHPAPICASEVSFYKLTSCSTKLRKEDVKIIYIFQHLETHSIPICSYSFVLFFLNSLPAARN